MLVEACLQFNPLQIVADFLKHQWSMKNCCIQLFVHIHSFIFFIQPNLKANKALRKFEIFKPSKVVCIYSKHTSVSLTCYAVKMTKLKQQALARGGDNTHVFIKCQSIYNIEILSYTIICCHITLLICHISTICQCVIYCKLNSLSTLICVCLKDKIYNL